MANGEDVAILWPLLTATGSLVCLAILGYGLALAPPPQPPAEEVASEGQRLR
jgi:hypothetical protein